MNRLIEAMDFESPVKNWRFPFSTMTKKYGKEWISLLQAMWQANNGIQSVEEFCKMNDLPDKFFQNVIST